MPNLRLTLSPTETLDVPMQYALRGLSAYEIAVRNGFEGTEEEWLASLAAGGGGSGAWSDLTGVPDTFPPADHTHAIADVTGLQTALDGKEAAGNAAAAVAAHEGAADPHSQYSTAAEVSAALSAALASYQPLDSDLTAIAALTTTSYGRAFLALADQTAGRTALGLGTAATAATGDFDAAGAAAAAQAASQPLDSDLTAIAALSTTSYGRALLALADAAALRTAAGLGTLATQDGTFSGTSSGTNTGDETGARIAVLNHGAAEKTALVDADEVVGGDSESSFGLIRSTWTSVKAFLKTYFDTLYCAVANANVFTAMQTIQVTTTNASVDGLALEPATAATGSALNLQKRSPRLRLRGHGWNTSAGASQPVDWYFDVSPGSGNPISSTFSLNYIINGGSITTPLQYSLSGGWSLTGNVTASEFRGAVLANKAMGASSDYTIRMAATTTATSGNQKWSPAIEQEGSGWKTNATAGAQTVTFRQEVIPVQGAAAPTGLLNHSVSIAGAAFSNVMQVQSDGVVLSGSTDSATVPGFAFINRTTSGLGHNGADLFLIRSGVSICSAQNEGMNAGTKLFGFGTSSQAAIDTALGRSGAAGLIEVNSGTVGTFRDLKLRGLSFGSTLTVGTLPTASASEGLIYRVSDSSAPAVGSTVSGGGSTKCTVQSDASAWKVVWIA